MTLWSKPEIPGLNDSKERLAHGILHDLEGAP